MPARSIRTVGCFRYASSHTPVSFAPYCNCETSLLPVSLLFKQNSADVGDIDSLWNTHPGGEVAVLGTKSSISCVTSLESTAEIFSLLQFKGVWAIRLSSGSGEQVKRNPGCSVAAGLYNRAPGGFDPSELLRQNHRDHHSAMKFGEKYELLESLTTGAIETFAANDKVRGERVLVHIVECAPQKPEQSTSEWVLESFRRLSPEPPGPILETGKYSGALYGYVVTKPADEAAVKSWARRYELLSQETRETSFHGLKQEVKEVNVSAQPAMPASGVKPQESSPIPGQMTQLLRDFDSLVKSKSPIPAPESPLPARPMNLGGESGLHAAAWDPASVKPAAPLKDKMPESFSSPAKPVSPELPPASSREGPKPGEFTSFFQGPFRGDAPSDVPAFSSEPIEPPRKTVGEFTAMFGQAPPVAPESGPGNQASATGFTGLFRDMEKPQPISPSAPRPGGVMPPSVEPLPMPSSSREPSLSPQAPIFVTPSAPLAEPVAAPLPPMPAAPPEKPLPARPSPHSGDGATGAFLRPSAEVIPTPVAPPSLPSPYTQIISRPKPPHAEEEAIQAHPSAGPAGGFAAPPMPKIPAPAPPPLPKIPPPPPMPKVTAPKPPAAPKLPKLDAPPPPPVSSWPLVITLTVLFFLAVILVLYFVLKH